MPQRYAHVQAAVDALTGPVGTNVRVYTNGDTDDYHEGRVADQVVMADRLTAVVLDLGCGDKVAVFAQSIDAIHQLPEDPS